MDNYSSALVAQLAITEKNLLEMAYRVFDADIRNPQLNPGGLGDHERFILRINEIGYELNKQGAYALAAKLYRDCIGHALQYREDYNVQRHLGTLYANLAINCLNIGDIDQALYNFQKAALEDFLTAGTDPAASHANKLLHSFRTQVVTELAELVSTHRLGITGPDIENLFINIPPVAYFALLTYGHSLYLNWKYLEDLGTSPWPYTYTQMITSLRTLTTVFEDTQRSYLRGMTNPKDLHNILQDLYASGRTHAATWWSAFSTEQNTLGNLRKNTPGRTDLDTIGDIISMALPDAESKVVNALLMTYFTRNYLGHNLTRPSDISLATAADIVGCILYAFIHVR